MRNRFHRLFARANTGIALIMLPLLVLMPLLHGHPLGAVASDHPVGVHFPAASGPSNPSVLRAGGGVSSAAPGPAADGSAPATIVVQEARLRGSARSLALQRSVFIGAARGPLVSAGASDRGRPGPAVERPHPWLDAQQAQAPPAGAAAVAAVGA